MNLLTTNQIHAACCDSKYYNTSDAIINYQYLAHYLDFCNNVTVLMRCIDVSDIKPTWPRLDGAHIDICRLPDPSGPFSAILALPVLIRDIIRAARRADVYYLKLPDATGALVGLVLLCTGRAYAVEVVADCKKGIMYAKSDLPLVRFYAWFFDLLTGFLVKRSKCATYVSKYLQNRYPHRDPAKQWLFCSVDLTGEFMGSARDKEFFQAKPFRLIAAGRLCAEKGHTYLIQAFKGIRERADISVELHLLGDGPLRMQLEQQVKDLDLTDSVYFHGMVTRGKDLFSHLDKAHLYIMPSLTEGMGRSMIEAMARGLPCTGSAVGGIPEYLDREYLFNAQSADAITEKVLDLIHDPEKLAAMSRDNINKSQAFTAQSLKAVKQDFWNTVIS